MKISFEFKKIYYSEKLVLTFSIVQVVNKLLQIFTYITLIITIKINKL